MDRLHLVLSACAACSNALEWMEWSCFILRRWLVKSQLALVCKIPGCVRLFASLSQTSQTSLFQNLFSPLSRWRELGVQEVRFVSIPSQAPCFSACFPACAICPWALRPFLSKRSLTFPPFGVSVLNFGAGHHVSP